MAPKEMTIERQYKQAELEHISRNPKSQALYQAATSALPGGNTRSVLFYAPFPIYTIRAQGCTLYDADGHSYTDLLGEYTAGLYGHSEPLILQAITETASNGLNFGSHHVNETRLASLIKERFMSIELIRFTNSGTEANLMALATAKVHTQRSKIMVFNGGYHGGTFLFHHGNDPINVPHEYLFATYNSPASVDALLATHADDLAAIIIEPMLGSGGCIPATRDFLQHLRQKATDTGAVLIFDEVMTSRFYSGGGVQSEFGIYPDLTTLGKYIGGGMSFGAFGGNASIMALFDPRTGSIRHAGTFNNNVMTMAAGSVGLEKIFTQQRARELHARGEKFRHDLNEIGAGTLLKVLGCGSLMTVCFTATPVEDIRNPGDVKDGNTNMVLGDLFHLWLLNRGIYIARRGFIALSLALGEEELNRFLASVKGFLVEYEALVKL